MYTHSNCPPPSFQLSLHNTWLEHLVWFHKPHQRTVPLETHLIAAVNTGFLSGISHRCWGLWQWRRAAENVPTTTWLLSVLLGFNRLLHARLGGWRQTVRVRQCNFVVLIHLSHPPRRLSSQDTGTTANCQKRSKWSVMNEGSLSRSLMTHIMPECKRLSGVMLTNDFTPVLCNVFPAGSSDIPSIITNTEMQKVIWHHTNNHNYLHWLQFIYNVLHIIKGWPHWGKYSCWGGHGGRRKQDASLFIQDVCYCVKWSMQIYIGDFSCPHALGAGAPRT